jgi:hypothetical protein
MKKYLLLLLPLCFMACEEDELNDYMGARQCLNNASASNAQSCVSSLAGDNSARANKLRCAAGFIQQNFTNARLATIFSKIQGSGGSNFTDFSVELVFRDANGTDGKTLVNSTNDYCLSSGSTGMIMFSSVSFSSTLVAYANGYDGDGAPLRTEISADPTLPSGEPEELGAALLAIENSYCSSGSAEDDLCANIDAIITDAGGTSDLAALGNALADYFQ